MSLKILFMGTPHFAAPILKAIFNSHHKILAAYTQPPKKKSRGQKIIKSPVHIEAEKLKLQVRAPRNLNNETDWKFQYDNNNPESLKRLFIRKGVYHRLIKGTGELKLKVIKLLPSTIIICFFIFYRFT